MVKSMAGYPPAILLSARRSSCPVFRGLVNDGSAGGCKAPPTRAPAPTALSSPPAALARGAWAVRPVPQIPRVLCARGAGARARRHHALLERVEGAVPAAAAAGIDRAPRLIGFGSARARVDGGQGGDREQQHDGDADRFHDEPPDQPLRPFRPFTIFHV